MFDILRTLLENKAMSKKKYKGFPWNLASDSLPKLAHLPNSIMLPQLGMKEAPGGGGGRGKGEGEGAAQCSNFGYMTNFSVYSSRPHTTHTNKFVVGLIRIDTFAPATKSTHVRGS